MIDPETEVPATEPQREAPETEAPATRRSADGSSADRSAGDGAADRNTCDRGTAERRETEQKYEVTVNNGIGSGEYAAGEMVSVEAPYEGEDGEVFSQWQTSSTYSWKTHSRRSPHL